MASWASLRSFLRDRGRTIASVVLAFAAAWALCAIYFTHEAVLQHYGAALPLSSDNVAPHLLFDDLFRRGLPFAGWMFPEAPFFVPDIVLGWIAYALSGSLVGAVELYALISATAFAWLVRIVLRRAGYDAIAWPIWLVLWLAASAAGVSTPPSWLSHLYGYIFIPYIHSGMLLGVCAGLALLLRSDGGRALVALALLAIAMLVSDRLFAVQFIAPAILVCAWRRSSWDVRAALLLAAILVASELFRWLSGAPLATEGNDRTPIAVSLDAIATTLPALARNDPFGTLILVAALVASVVSLRKRSNEHALSHRRLLAAFALASTVLPVAATLLLGRYHSFEEIRYFQSMQLLMLPLAGTLAAGVGRVAIRNVPAASWVAAAIAIVATPMLMGSTRAALRGYLVDQETCLRDAIAREHLQLGAATYWRANEMTARFPRGPVVVPLSGDIAPRMRNIVDLGWLSPMEPGATLPALGFVDEHGYAPDALDRVFGPASRRVVCPRSSYRLYAPEDGALAKLHRHADWLPSQLLERTGVALVPAAAWAAEDRFVAGDAVHAIGSFARPTHALATAFDVPRGALAVEIAYAMRAQAGRAHWHAAIVNEAGAVLAELGTGTLDPSEELRRFALPLGERPASGNVLGVSLAVEGDVDLRVATVRVAVR